MLPFHSKNFSNLQPMCTMFMENGKSFSLIGLNSIFHVVCVHTCVYISVFVYIPASSYVFPFINKIIFIVTGLSALVKYLNKPKYSTIIYVLRGQGAKDFGYCGMSSQLKATFNKTVLFWPCPKMKVSVQILSLRMVNFFLRFIC